MNRDRKRTIWDNMRLRCRDYYQQQKPTYMGCYLSENFKSFPFFKDWCENQIGFHNPSFQLDKDVLVFDNKIYGEDYCVFVPREVNMFISGSTSKSHVKNGLPLGVTYNKHAKKYMAQCSLANGTRYLGLFSKPEEAYIAYCIEKDSQARILAEKYGGQIDPRVTKILNSYSTEERSMNV